MQTPSAISSAPGANRWPRLLAALGAVAIAAVVYFDLGPPLAFNDDWTYAWSVRQLVSGHGLRVPAEQVAVAMFHIGWGAALTLGHPDQRWLRLAILPLTVLGAFSTFKIARRLGADRFWAVMAGLVMSANPVVLALTTTFMTDAAYAGLLITSCWLAMRWWQEGTGVVACICLIVLAVLERQLGVGVAIALSAALVFAPRRPRTNRDLVGLLALWGCAAAAIFLPIKLMETATQVATFTQPGARDVFNTFLALFVLPATAGLALLPFMLAVPPRRPRIQGPAGTVAATMVAVIALLLLLPLAGVYPPRGGAFIGDYFTARGLNPHHLGGFKTQLYPLYIYLPLGFLSVITALVAVTWRAPMSRVPGLTRGAVFLGCVAATQMVPLIHIGVLDRYFVPVMAPLIPAAAALASLHSSRLSRAWATGVVVLFLGLYVVGEQDYQAWQQARDLAARQAITMVPAGRLSAGYEANAVYFYLPLQERDPSSPLLPRLTAAGNPELVGPPDPCIRLEFASIGDKRPGVDYHSLASARVILVTVHNPCPPQ